MCSSSEGRRQNQQLCVCIEPSGGWRQPASCWGWFPTEHTRGLYGGSSRSCWMFSRFWKRLAHPRLKFDMAQILSEWRWDSNPWTADHKRDSPRRAEVTPRSDITTTHRSLDFFFSLRVLLQSIYSLSALFTAGRRWEVDCPLRFVHFQPARDKVSPAQVDSDQSAAVPVKGPAPTAPGSHEDHRGDRRLWLRGLQHLHDLGGQQPVPAHHRTRPRAERPGGNKVRPGVPQVPLWDFKSARSGELRRTTRTTH